MNPTRHPLEADRPEDGQSRIPSPGVPAGDACDDFEQRRSERLQRLRRLGDLMAHLAERIETPDPSTLSAGDAPPRAEDELLERLQQLEVTVRNLLICVRGGGLERRPLPAAVLIGRCIDALLPQLGATGATLAVDSTLPAEVEVLVHPEAFVAMLQTLAEPWLAHGVRLQLGFHAGADGRPQLDCRRHAPGAQPARRDPLAARVARIVAQAHAAELSGDPADGRLTLRLPALDLPRDPAAEAGIPAAAAGSGPPAGGQRVA